MDDDDFETVEEVLMLDLDEEGRRHNKWTLGTILMEFFCDILKVGAKFFDALAEASYQHGTKEIKQRELHELVTRDLETLPVTEEPNA